MILSCDFHAQWRSGGWSIILFSPKLHYTAILSCPTGMEYSSKSPAFRNLQVSNRASLNIHTRLLFFGESIPCCLKDSHPVAPKGLRVSMQGLPLFKHPVGSYQSEDTSLLSLQVLLKSMKATLEVHVLLHLFWWWEEKNLFSFSTKLKTLINCSLPSSRPQGSRLEVESGRG